jgi:hypothetical protein
MSMNELHQRIIELPVFDTHSHVNAPGRPIGARSFADVGHYFWLSQQMNGVGWKASETIDQPAAEAYFDAFIKTENTAMNWCLRRILLDLYGVTIHSPKDILIADSIIRERADTIEHIEAVCRKGNIKKVVQNLETQAEFAKVPSLGVLVADTLNAPVASFLKSPSDDSIDQAVSSLCDSVDAMAQASQVGARIDFDLFQSMENEAWRNALLDAIFSRLHAHGMFVQVFIGMNRQPQGSFPQNDPRLITQLYPYFLKYPNCRYEFLCAAEGSCMDVVQAAVKHPNVNPGGLWWYTFRPSMFMQTMEQRFEALAPLKCPILASDATCIEWCYGKSMLVKSLAAQFLTQKVADGWTSGDCALRTASAWFYDAPAAYYE